MRNKTKAILIIGVLFVLLLFSLPLLNDTVASGFGNQAAQQGTQVPATQTSDPVTTSPLVEIGNTFLAANMPDKAIEYYVAALKVNPEDDEALAKLAEALDASVEDSGETTEEEAEVSLYDIGEIYFNAGMTEEAIELYIEALKGDTASEDGLILLETAIATLDIDDPNLELARTYAESGDLAKAIELYSAVLESDPSAVLITTPKTTPDDASVLALAKSAIAESNNSWKSSWQEIRDLLIDGGIWLVVILILYFLSRLVRRIIKYVRNKRKQAIMKKIEDNPNAGKDDVKITKTFVVNPFNSTLPSAKAGYIHAVRDGVMKSIVNNGHTCVSDAEVKAPDFPDMGSTVIKLFKWLWGFIIPPPEVITIDGTLIDIHDYVYGKNDEPKKVIGITVRKVDPGETETSKVTQIETFRFPGPKDEAQDETELDIGDYMFLTGTVGHWVVQGAKLHPKYAQLWNAAGEMLSKQKDVEDTKTKEELEKEAFRLIVSTVEDLQKEEEKAAAGMVVRVHQDGYEDLLEDNYLKGLKPDLKEELYSLKDKYNLEKK